jgi:hypothetical protein
LTLPPFDEKMEIEKDAQEAPGCCQAGDSEEGDLEIPSAAGLGDLDLLSLSFECVRADCLSGLSKGSGDEVKLDG